METVRKCPGCGKPLAADAPQGICPECLIQAALASGTDLSGARPKPGFPPPSAADVSGWFPQLEVLELIGHGGMGAVYKARQPALNRFAALKILPPAVAEDSSFAERFNREARALARLNHPNIVAVYDFGVVRAGTPAARRDALAGGEGGAASGATAGHARGADSKTPGCPSAMQGPATLHYFIMEYVDGTNLREIERSGRLAPEQALAIVPQICDALQFAHNEGVIHRDIKPENILLDRKGRVKITDFGIAKILGGAAGQQALTGAKDVVGTPHYMAPEQVEQPQTVDHRADIYSLGVVFYELLTGELPLGRFRPPSNKVQIDVRLDEVVLRALEKEPERRYQQASQVKQEVETIVTQPAPARRRQTTPRPAGRWTRYLLGLFLLAVVPLTIWLKPERLNQPAAPATGPTTAEPGREAEDRPPTVVITEVVRHEVGRQLRESGARYDSLSVTVAIDRDSATPFRVSYRGLQNFAGSDGTMPAADGEFIMEYIGSGQWQGTLAGTKFTVQVGSRDNIDVPFVDDPDVIGEWETVDFISDPAQFKPDHARPGELPWKGLTFLSGGKTAQPWLTWTRGLLFHQGDRTASRYEIRVIQGQPFLFLEWKSGDVTISGRKPDYYVLRLKPSEPRSGLQP